MQKTTKGRHVGYAVQSNASMEYIAQVAALIHANYQNLRNGYSTVRQNQPSATQPHNAEVALKDPLDTVANEETLRVRFDGVNADNTLLLMEHLPYTAGQVDDAHAKIISHLYDLIAVILPGVYDFPLIQRVPTSGDYTTAPVIETLGDRYARFQADPNTFDRLKPAPFEQVMAMMHGGAKTQGAIRAAIRVLAEAVGFEYLDELYPDVLNAEFGTEGPDGFETASVMPIVNSNTDPIVAGQDGCSLSTISAIYTTMEMNLYIFCKQIEAISETVSQSTGMTNWAPTAVLPIRGSMHRMYERGTQINTNYKDELNANTGVSPQGV